MHDLGAPPPVVGSSSGWSPQPDEALLKARAWIRRRAAWELRLRQLHTAAGIEGTSPAAVIKGPKHLGRFANVLPACLLAVAVATTSAPAAGAAPKVKVQSGGHGDGGSAASSTVWLCRPGLADKPCNLSRTATVLKPDGSKRVQKAKPAKKPPIDCFFVYQTVSSQPTLNANLDIDPELIATAEKQASRFSEVCRVFAPVYPQITLDAIDRGRAIPLPADVPPGPEEAIAYSGVQSAWDDYLANFNKGRGVVLIGHSQGAGLLTRLARNALDKDPTLRRQLVSALLIGGNVTVAAGQDTGGSFTNIPACRADDQNACVVAYSTYDVTPPAGSLFVRTGRPGQEVLCVNPGAPDGGVDPLEPYFRTEPFPDIEWGVGVPPPFGDLATPWAMLPKLYSAECMQADGASWLQVNRVAGAGDVRPQVVPVPFPFVGLHVADVNLALGDLVDLVRTQSAAYRAAH